MGEAHGATSVSLRIVNLRGELGRWYRRLGYREIGVAPYVRPAKRACHFVELARDPTRPAGRPRCRPIWARSRRPDPLTQAANRVSFGR